MFAPSLSLLSPKEGKLASLLRAPYFDLRSVGRSPSFEPPAALCIGIAQGRFLSLPLSPSLPPSLPSRRALFAWRWQKFSRASPKGQDAFFRADEGKLKCIAFQRNYSMVKYNAKIPPNDNQQKAWGPRPSVDCPSWEVGSCSLSPPAKIAIQVKVNPTQAARP